MLNFLKKSHSASSRLQPLPVLALVSVAVARMVPLPTWQVTTLQVLMPRPTGTTWMVVLVILALVSTMLKRKPRKGLQRIAIMRLPTWGLNSPLVELGVLEAIAQRYWAHAQWLCANLRKLRKRRPRRIGRLWTSLLEHSLLVYTVQAPLEFYDLDIEVEDANGTHNRFSRPQNSDEYNPSPNWVVVTAESASDRSIGNMLRFDNLKPSNGEVIIRGFTPSGQGVGPGVNGIQVLLNTDNVDSLPSITANPESTNGVVGGGLELNVGVSGDNLQIQWYRNGQAIDGANSDRFIIGELTAEDAGAYSVAVSNGAGRIASKNAVVDVVSSSAISEGLVAHLPFDGNANDAAGGSNGQAKNGAGFGSGKIGQAVELDGTDDWVYVPDYSKVSGAMTASAWINSSDGFFGPIIRNWVQELGDGRFGQFMIDIPFPDDAASPLAVGRLSVGPNEPVASHPISTSDGGAWHHIAMTANEPLPSTGMARLLLHPII